MEEGGTDSFSFSFPSDIEIFLPGLHSGHCKKKKKKKKKKMNEKNLTHLAFSLILKPRHKFTHIWTPYFLIKKPKIHIKNKSSSTAGQTRYLHVEE